MDANTIDTTILELTAARGTSKTVCPSEVARHLAPADWRPLMEDIRQRARLLAEAGRIDITQGGQPLDPAAEIRGPIRLRLREAE